MEEEKAEEAMLYNGIEVIQNVITYYKMSPATNEYKIGIIE